MNGKSLAGAVAARWPNTRIAFMSGYAEDAIVHNGIIDAGVVLLTSPSARTARANRPFDARQL